MEILDGGPLGVATRTIAKMMRTLNVSHQTVYNTLNQTPGIRIQSRTKLESASWTMLFARVQEPDQNNENTQVIFVLGTH